MDCIKIGKPYILRGDGYSRLCADICDNGTTKTLYYEVENIFEDYLNVDNSDTFVLGLLHNAMNVGKNLVCEGGVTKRLLFQLNNYYIPVVSKQMPDLHLVSVSSYEEGAVCQNKHGVMTGCSGGVDSFYTMLKYKDIAEYGYSLTHIMFNNISTADNNEERIRKLFIKDSVEKKQVAKELGLIPVMLYTNLFTFYKSQHIYNFYFASQYVSAPYALGRLVGIYYFSSGVSVSDFSMDYSKIKDGAYFDLFSLNCLSNDYISVYSAGSEVSRFEKTKYISENNVVKQHLQVCSEEQYLHFYEKGNPSLDSLNCGCCGKCRRTISTLYSLGCLNDYEGVFDLSSFNKNKEKFIAKELIDDAKTFTEEIKVNLKTRKLNFGKLFLYKIPFSIRHSLRKCTKLRRVYRRIRYNEK